jgi:beta-glucosidase
MQIAAMERHFPEHFLWGTATAAYHVEGDNRGCDWWEFEREPGRIINDDRSGIACDSYNRYGEDFALMKSLNLNSHRLSIEWSRIESAPGEFDARQIDHYRDVLNSLHALGIAPMVTLHHFTSPLWFARRGGWASSGAADAFLDFVRVVIRELGGLIPMWCTINEPNLYAYWGWIGGAFPPGRKGDVVGFLRVLANMRHPHERAYAAIKEAFPAAAVAAVNAKVVMFPHNAQRRIDRWAASLSQTMLDSWPRGWVHLQNVFESSSDYVGVNHYYGQTAAFDLKRASGGFVERGNPPGSTVSEAGYAINPEWMRQVLLDLAILGKPIYVTESGLAANDDELRCRYLPEVLAQVHAAIASGADVRGYFLFTLLDSFEWAQGYSSPFGLVEVDRKSLERRPKPSATLYSSIAAANALPYSRA